MTIIHANVYDPSVRSIFKTPVNTKAQCQTIDCSNFKECELYSNNQCVCRYVIGGYCPYGKQRIQYGYTRRARRFYNWISDKKELYQDVGFLDVPPTKLATIGDYIYLPYSYMDMYENLDMKNCFISKNDFSVEVIKQLCEFHPQAMFGGEIKSYQKEVIPLFIVHLFEKMPKLYDELCKIYPKAKKTLQSSSNIGRKALLSTVKPNIGVLTGIHSDDWVWDGEYLTMINKQAGFALVKHSEVRIKPLDKEVVKICSEDQIDENTIFID